MFHERMTCRAGCSSPLVEILDLGKTALANDFIEPAAVRDYRAHVPLRLNLCPSCSFLQLREVVDPAVLYSQYTYITSTSRTMDAHLKALADHLLAVAGFSSAPRVLEIASNTGLFLKKFQVRGCDVLGVEPAANISALAAADGVPTRTEFFDAKSAEAIRTEWNAADLIIGRHVFAHIDDLKGFLQALSAVSHNRTLIAFEVPYAVDFYEGFEFDTIYHEHLSYISVRGIKKLLENSPFVLHRVNRYPIHGGSIVFMLRHRDGSDGAHRSIDDALQVEGRLGLASPATWVRFSERVHQIQAELVDLIRGLRKKGKRVIGYGASAKGNTLLQSCGLGREDLDYIIDNTPFKQGRVAPGSWIPVASPERLLEDQPDFALLLAWNFAPEIIQREQQYQACGGRFIVPLPKPCLVPYPSKHAK
jgi:novobiocin biosynthesis protein NovU/D-mycarose 3-C-methyltransferase